MRSILLPLLLLLLTACGGDITAGRVTAIKIDNLTDHDITSFRIASIGDLRPLDLATDTLVMGANVLNGPIPPGEQRLVPVTPGAWAFLLRNDLPGHVLGAVRVEEGQTYTAWIRAPSSGSKYRHDQNGG